MVREKSPAAAKVTILVRTIHLNCAESDRPAHPGVFIASFRGFGLLLAFSAPDLGCPK
jgi:hypothetical protein